MVLLLVLPQALAQNDSFVCTGINAANNYNATIEYLGCYTDATIRTLEGPQINSATNDPQICADMCGYRGYNISGVEYTTQR
ncbi:hypothetical protein LTR85_000732 [Meristemomyces frigidus]|nr:hypothetical protein LTR85_000732 [Meristemomyces frigidus]